MSWGRKPANRPRFEGMRYETCEECGRDWNVSIMIVLDWRGYICPECRNRRIREREAKKHD